MAAALGITLVVGGGYLLCCCLPITMLGSHGGGDDGFILGFAPCMPFLLCSPEVIGMTLEPGYNGGPDREFGLFMAAYLIGTMGYAVAAGMIAVATVDQFDEKSGRVQGRASYSPRPPVPS